MFVGPGGTGRSPGGAEPHFGVLGVSRTSGPGPSPPKPHPFPDPFGEKRWAKRLQPWGDRQRKKEKRISERTGLLLKVWARRLELGRPSVQGGS